MEKITSDNIEILLCTLPQRRHHVSRPKWMILAALLLLTIWTLRSGEGTWFPLDSNQPSDYSNSEMFSWDEVTAKPYLSFVGCYDGEFQCAQLELPMDWWNGTTNATISLAVIKKPAVVPVTHPQYGGATLFNPGGPGGSGVGFLVGAAERLRAIIDSEDGKYFDLISFDPRGIGESTPTVQCFDDSFKDFIWSLRMAEQGVFSASDAALGRIWSMTLARGQSCSLPYAEGDEDIKKYVSTASAARDMLEIVERHGEWREKEAKRILGAEGHCYGSARADVLETLEYKAGEERINYWVSTFSLEVSPRKYDKELCGLTIRQLSQGFSYGSYLGNTFAAMFPDRINRLIVDGVVDAYDYKKALWFDNLVETEKDLDQFYYHCARVGFPLCALANETGITTAEGVKNRMQNITSSLYHNPLPVISSSGPGVITYSDVKYLTLFGLYSPIAFFPTLAEILFAIERGDGNIFSKILGVMIPMDFGSNREKPKLLGLGTQDAQMAIACGDGDDQSWMTKEDFAEHLKNVTELSPSIGEVWSTLRMTCIHYNVRPYHRFHGPWIANTSHPILEIGNSADPVTPGRFAKKMAKGFSGAVALIQDSNGHCSLSAPSKCTEKYVRQYFQTGELPPEDTVCKADAVPFGPGLNETGSLEMQALEVMQQIELENAMYAAGGGFLNEGVRRFR